MGSGPEGQGAGAVRRVRRVLLRAWHWKLRARQCWRTLLRPGTGALRTALPQQRWPERASAEKPGPLPVAGRYSEAVGPWDSSIDAGLTPA